MDYLRDQLRQVYGSEVACYSGRGGEVWNGIAWVRRARKRSRLTFAGKIRILLCTESASEGLNLQTCGVLINYDMPWNPMRVEQRIGRIDRIGQVYPVVWISNYFYQDTIEDQIYQRLADRIDWFEVVVGDLQPILAQVGEVTKRLAMLPASEREVQLEKEIADLRERLSPRGGIAGPGRVPAGRGLSARPTAARHVGPVGESARLARACGTGSSATRIGRRLPARLAGRLSAGHFQSGLLR